MKKIFFISLIVLVLGNAPFVLAQSPSPVTTPPLGPGEHEQAVTYTLLEPLPCIEGAGQNCTNTNGTITYVEKITIREYISYIYKLAIALAVFLAVVEIIWGGFEYMLSAVPFVKVQGKERINRAIFGLGAVLVSYLILQTIDPRLVQVSTTIPPICPPGTEEKAGSICNPTAANDFIKQLDQDLNKLSTENLQQVNDMEKKLIDLRGKREAAAKAVVTATASGNADAIKAAKEDLAVIEDQISRLESTQAQLLGVSTMYANFKQAIKGVTDGTANDSQIKTFTDSMKTTYDRYKANPAIAKDPAALTKLDFEYKFQLDQIEEQKRFAKIMKAHATNNSVETKALLGYMGIYGKIIEVYKDSTVKTAEDQMNVHIKVNQQLLEVLTLDAKIGESPELMQSIKNDPVILDAIKKLKTNVELKEQYVTLLRSRNDMMRVAIENKRAGKK